MPYVIEELVQTRLAYAIKILLIGHLLQKRGETMKIKGIMLLLIAIGAILVMTNAASADPGNGATVVKEGAIYYDGVLYRTVLTPTDLPDKAPEKSFDILYNFGMGGQPSVAEAAPGVKGYNGGRWIVYAVSFNVAPYELTSVQEVLDAEAAGDITISDEPVKRFVCPMIKLK